MITELFIKQCKQAEEIQEGWKPEEYDIFTYDGTSLFRYPLVKRTKEWMAKHAPIWLPTQEQLQEMLKYYYHYATPYQVKDLGWGDSINEYMLKKLMKFEKNNREIVYDLNSLWLAFVMHELYNKIWTGEKWEEIIC